MNKMSEWIREYRFLMDKEKEIEKRKEILRGLISEEMESRNVKVFRCEYGVAKISERFKLIPKRKEVLGLLSLDDLFLFAQFNATKVKEWLVPKYGREKLLPLFFVETSSCVQVVSRDKRRDCLLFLEGSGSKK